MKFWAYVKQEAEGCDYTIGCGQTVWRFEADTWEDAVVWVKREVIGHVDAYGDHPGYHGERELGEVILCQVVRSDKMPLREWYDEFRETLSKQAIAQIEADDQALYEKLRRKYEGK